MKRTLVLAIGLCLMGSGCAGPQWQLTRRPIDEVAPKDVTVAKAEPKTPAGAKSDAPANVEPDAELESLLEQLRSDGKLTYQDETRLRADLQKVPPSVRPLLTARVKASIRHREAKEQKDADRTPDRAPGLDNPLRKKGSNDRKQRISRDRPAQTQPSDAVAWASHFGADGRLDALDDTSAQRIRHAMATFLAEKQRDDPVLDDPQKEPSNRNDHDSSDRDPGDGDVNDGEDLGDWRDHLANAIIALERGTGRTVFEESGSVRDEVLLRLLYLVDDRNSDAIRPIEQLNRHEQQFWTHQLHGLGICLNDEETPVPQRRAALTLQRLREAADNLAAVSTLDVRNVAFCTKVHGFGCYDVFKQYEFKPDQEVVLYVEVDNFTTDQTPEGFQTEMLVSYQILDSVGRRVAVHNFPAAKETCRNRRHDFFIPFHMWMPKNAYDGNYILQVTVEDVLGKKFGQSSIDFSIKH